MGRVHEEIQIDQDYERDYEVEVLIDSPTSQTIARYGSNDGAILKIYPRNLPPFVYTVRESLDELQLSSWPDPSALVTLPDGFLIRTTDPGGSSKYLTGFDGHPVHYIHRLHSPDFVLVGHCCGIYCYDATGMRWSREDVFCCDDPLIDIAGDDVILVAHKHGVDGKEPTRKVLSLSTGELRN